MSGKYRDEGSDRVQEAGVTEAFSGLKEPNHGKTLRKKTGNDTP